MTKHPRLVWHDCLLKNSKLSQNCVMILSKFKDKEARSMQRIYWNCADTVLWLQCAWHCVVLTLCQHFDTMLTLYWHCAVTAVYWHSAVWHCAVITVCLTLCCADTVPTFPHYADTLLCRHCAVQCADTVYVCRSSSSWPWSMSEQSLSTESNITVLSGGRPDHSYSRPTPTASKYLQYFTYCKNILYS